ncbi:MAG: pilus assembly protein TadG-related protein [Planctomycetota bacterium]
MTAMSQRPTPRPRRVLRARSARQRGVVIIIAVFSIFLIAGMIGYVFNTGRHAQLRQETQNAADAVAVGGAGYVARSFNTVAMNNVEISRLIAAVQMLDSIPLAVEYTLADQIATLEVTERQLARGTAGDRFLRTFLEAIRDDLIRQIALLTEMDQFFNRSGYDVREMTFYNGPNGRGEMWKAMESLDALSQSTMEYVGELQQVSAIQSGRENMHHQGETTAAFTAPFRPRYIWRRYAFDDFRPPVTRGRLPDWVDDEVTNRGPYDTIFGWHSSQREDVEIPNPDGNDRVTDGFGSRWSGGIGRGNGSTVVSSRVTSYTTFGTWQWLGRVLRASIDTEGVLYNSQFVTRVNRMAGNKLNYIWPGSAREWVFLDPQWITSYEEARAIVEAGTPRAAYTQFFRLDQEEIITHLPNDPVLLYAIGVDTNPIVQPRTLVDWHILRPRGARLTVPGAQKIGDHIWEDTASVEYDERWTRQIRNVEDRPQIIQALLDNPNYVVAVYEGGAATVTFDVTIEEKQIRQFTWAGMNVGPQIEIRNPNNFTNRNDLPAPIDFDHGAMFRPQDGAVGQPGEPFAFLGVAKQRNTAPMWNELFSSGAYDGHVAVAQAGVFNNHSWDLWTQMWHAQLEPVQDYAGWVDLMQETMGDASGFPNLEAGEVSGVAGYLRSVEELAPILLNH